jgi:predicted metal-dependent hydrolase
MPRLDRHGPDLIIDGYDLPVVVRTSPRSRRLILRLDPDGQRFVVTVPPGVSRSRVREFLAHHVDWARQRLRCMPVRIDFAAGAIVPYLGIDHQVRHAPSGRTPVTRTDGAFLVTGRPEHLARRLRDFLIREARRELTDRVLGKAGQLGVRPAGVTIRDTRSRWGSCSATGRLNFSWRLILAPEPVLDYVVAHEVAHLVEMNHSPRFWAIVARLDPDARAQRRWLKRNGAHLHRYG